MDFLKVLFSAGVGALLAHFFWRERFRETRTADYYREVLEKLISPFYLWLLYGRIKTKNRNLDPSVPAEQLEKMIIFSNKDDVKIVELLKDNLHLAAVDSRLFDQVKEFLACYEFNYDQPETRNKVYEIYKSMENLYNEYSAKYQDIMLLRDIVFWKKFGKKKK